MVKGWFRIDEEDSAYNNFVKALLLDDVDAMNEFINKIALQSFSSFDVAKMHLIWMNQNVFIMALCLDFWWNSAGVIF